jgi:hypothetical protein
LAAGEKGPAEASVEVPASSGRVHSIEDVGMQVGMQVCVGPSPNRSKRLSTDSLLEAMLQADKDEPPAPPDVDENDLASKEAHARYMRFWRTTTTNKRKAAPPCVMVELAKIRKEGGATRGAFTFLFEDWMQAKEDWCGT